MLVLAAVMVMARYGGSWQLGILEIRENKEEKECRLSRSLSISISALSHGALMGALSLCV